MLAGSGSLLVMLRVTYRPLDGAKNPRVRTAAAKVWFQGSLDLIGSG